MRLVRTERRGDVSIVVLSRPEKRNALTPEMFEHLGAELTAATSAGAVVLAGDGPTFCGGFDLELCLHSPGTLRRLLIALRDAITHLRTFDTPVVIAAHGAAIAGGCGLLGGGDLVITDQKARLGYPVVRIGISPAVTAPFLSLRIGDGPARARLLDSGLINGEEAMRIGLVDECVAGVDEVLGVAIERAAAMASKPRASFAETKRWLRTLDAALSASADDALAASLSIVDSPEERELLARALSKS